MENLIDGLESLEEIDPLEYIFNLVQDAKHKELALKLTNMIAPSNCDDDENEIGVRTAAYHIFSSVYIWNDDYENASRFQELFLTNLDWRENHFDIVEIYLAMVFVKNNIDFICTMLENYPFIKTKFSKIYYAYLSSIVEPNSEEYFSQNLMKQYNLLLQVKRLYVD